MRYPVIAFTGLALLFLSAGAANPRCEQENVVAKACDAVFAAFTQVPGGKTTREAVPGHGCRLSIEGTFSGLGDSRPPDRLVQPALEPLGWSRDSTLDADGPDGTSFVLRNDKAECRVEGWWGDAVEARPAARPGDSYVVTVDVRQGETAARAQLQ
ncbi:MAG: hypothetical protein ACE148_07885 [Vicinamibacterales bacterium]